MKSLISLAAGIFALAAFAEREYLWPDGKMPDAQPRQIAAMTDESRKPGFNPDEWRRPYIEWFDAPEKPNGTCMILISGGGYDSCCDVELVNRWNRDLTALGCQCVNLVYRTPRPEGLPIYQSAWEDGQRAVRLVRSQAKERGFFPEKIGTVSMSAGSHLAVLLATSSMTPAYAKIDDLDNISCETELAIAFAPAYVLTDGYGTPNTLGGDAPGVALADCFKFDANTPPMCLLHGGKDKYSPIGSTRIYRELRKRGIPAEVHIAPGKGHGAYGFDRAVEFMRQLDFFGDRSGEVALMDRYASDGARAFHLTQPLWPEGKVPDFQPHQTDAFIEWHIPTNLVTRDIQIVWPGGAYRSSKTDDFEVAPIRRFLNEKGMAVVTLNYRHPRPDAPLPKHMTAWQDAQRAIRLVRKEAVKHGLDPDNIGIMGSSAGGHLALVCATSSNTHSYLPVDDTDELPCDVQWAIALYPAYALTDGLEKPGKNGGNGDDAVLSPEFAFDLDTPPMLFLHGDADVWPAMNSVKAWERLRRMGIQGELHTLATRGHCFQRTASPGTGSYDWMDRVWSFIRERRAIQRKPPQRKTSQTERRPKRMTKMTILLLATSAFLLGGCIAYKLPPSDRRITLAPDLAGDVMVTDVRMTRDTSRHYVFQANVVNNTDRIVKIEYKVDWMGDTGVEIPSIVSNWKFRSIAPREVASLSAVAPVEYACDFRFHAQPARPALQ